MTSSNSLNNELDEDAPHVGRPTVLARQIKQAKELSAELKSIRELAVGFKVGRERLVDEYPMLVEQAIEVAQSGNNDMLKTLLLLVPRLIGEDIDEDEDTGIKRLVKGLKSVANLTLEQHNYYRPVVGDERSPNSS